MRYPSPYGREEHLALENQQLRGALKDAKQRASLAESKLDEIRVLEDLSPEIIDILER